MEYKNMPHSNDHDNFALVMRLAGSWNEVMGCGGWESVTLELKQNNEYFSVRLESWIIFLSVQFENRM